MGVSQVFRARLGSGENASDDSGQRTIRVAHPDTRLARQACIDQRVVPRAAIKLGKNHAWDDDLSPEARCCP